VPSEHIIFFCKALQNENVLFPSKVISFYIRTDFNLWGEIPLSSIPFFFSLYYHLPLTTCLVQAAKQIHLIYGGPIKHYKLPVFADSRASPSHRPYIRDISSFNGKVCLYNTKKRNVSGSSRKIFHLGIDSHLLR
jgi:hypothetical protein